MESSGKQSLNEVFGLRLKALRRAKGWTQEELGRAAELDYKHISGIERGIQPPSFAAVERIARTLKVDFFELFLPPRIVSNEIRKAAAAMAVRPTRVADKQAIALFLETMALAVRQLESHIDV